MRRLSMCLFCGLLVVAVLRLSAAEAARSSGLSMADAAAHVLEALSPEQRKAVAYPLGDPERVNWHFVPLQDAKTKRPTRKGVPLEEMSAAARSATLELLKAGTSPEAYRTCLTIFEREGILAEAEPNNRWFRRPGWYFLTVFGVPSRTGHWGWRLEGHHLSLSFTVDAGECVSATPAFYGMNPVTVKKGPKAGDRALAGCEDLARELFLSLDPAQRKVALQSEDFQEVSAKSATPPDDDPVGITGDRLTPVQRAKLDGLITHYLERLPADVAARERAKIDAAGLDKVHFAYTGSAEPFQPHTYRVTGPACFIHYMNAQADTHGNPANHIHSVYRSADRDFGGR